MNDLDAPARPGACAPGDPEWAAFEAAYAAVFAPAEREPLARVRQRAAAGRYRITLVGTAGATAAGFAIVDVVPEPAYAVLTFVGVMPPWRGQGLGSRLVQAAVEGVRDVDAPLLVEAAGEAQRLYARAGFRALALVYSAPVFGTAGACGHTLMIRGAAQHVDGRWLRAVVADMFIDGYGVAAGDARLQAQLARIGATVELSRC